MSRKKQLLKQARKGRRPRPDLDGLSADDPTTRGRAVRTLCPCRSGWDVYQENRDAVQRLCKDEDATVRFNALHVQDDAYLMELLEAKRFRAAEAAERRSRLDEAKRSARDRRTAAARRAANPY